MSSPSPRGPDKLRFKETAFIKDCSGKETILFWEGLAACPGSQERGRH